MSVTSGADKKVQRERKKGVDGKHLTVQYLCAVLQ